jgi:hypothetical protein
MNSLFPIYNVEAFSISLNIDDIPFSGVALVSLNKVFIEKPLVVNENINFSIKFKQQIFSFDGKVESETYTYRGRELTVISIYFKDIKTYMRWTTFIKVIHKTKLKKQLQSLL